MKVRNRTLYNYIRNFVKASIQVLKEKYPSNQDLAGFIKHVTKYSIEDRGFARDDDFQVDFSLLVFFNSNYIERLPEFINCAKYFLKNPITRVAHGWRDQNNKPSKKLPLELTYFRPLSYFLGTHLSHVGGLLFHEEKFEEQYSYFEKSIYKTTIRQRITTPLIGFSSDVEEINFGNGFKIRKITEGKKIQCLQRMELPFAMGSIPLEFMDIQDMQYTLEAIISRSKQDLFSRTKLKTVNRVSPREVFHDIIMILRLFKRGYVGFNFIDTVALDWTSQGGIVTTDTPFRQSHWTPSSYILSETDIDSLLQLWRRYKKFKKSITSKRRKYITLALRRFNYGIEERDNESKVLDYFISFEALCLSERGELTYRLSNRVAILLGLDSEEAERIRNFIVKAYSVRSRIIHGEDVQPIKIEGKLVKLNQITQRIEEYLRQALRKFIRLSIKNRHETIISLLDQSMIDLRKRKLFKAS